MPEPRSFPRWLPRPGAKVTITFGDAINKAIDPILDRFDYAKGQDIQDNRSATNEANLDGLQLLSAKYPSPPADAFPPITPLMEPPGGVAWPVPMPESRSAAAIQSQGDSPSARSARSLIAAELRAHLLQLGELQGGDLRLAHRLMEEETDVKGNKA
jgi:hypothetical protein